MAQMQMAQTQMAMSGNSMYGGTRQPGMTADSSMHGNRMAAASNMSPGTMSSDYAPLDIPMRPLVQLEHPLDPLSGRHRIDSGLVGIFHE